MIVRISISRLKKIPRKYLWCTQWYNYNCVYSYSDKFNSHALPGVPQKGQDDQMRIRQGWDHSEMMLLKPQVAYMPEFLAVETMCELIHLAASPRYESFQSR